MEDEKCLLISLPQSSGPSRNLALPGPSVEHVRTLLSAAAGSRQSELTGLSKAPFFCCCYFRAAPWHMEIPRLEVELDLQLPPYTTAHSNA